MIAGISISLGSSKHCLYLKLGELAWSPSYHWSDRSKVPADLCLAFRLFRSMLEFPAQCWIVLLNANNCLAQCSIVLLNWGSSALWEQMGSQEDIDFFFVFIKNKNKILGQNKNSNFFYKKKIIWPTKKKLGGDFQQFFFWKLVRLAGKLINKQKKIKQICQCPLVFP